MILVDTSVWVDHLRAADRALMRLLEAGEIVTHPFVIGELALWAICVSVSSSSIRCATCRRRLLPRIRKCYISFTAAGCLALVLDTSTPTCSRQRG